jgi:ferritin
MADFDGALSELESRFELDSLLDLQAQRRQLIPEYASLRALHGPNGKWDAKRKALLEATKIRARMVCQQKNEKVTEGLIDAMAHADEQYMQFIEWGIEGATRFVVLENQIADLNERIENRKSSMFLAGQEIKQL